MNQSHHQVTTLTYHCIAQRPDGIGFASTSNDQRQLIEDNWHEPDVNLRLSALVLNERLEGSALALEGGLSTPAIASQDVVGGRWEGSTLQMYVGDWAENQEQKILGAGEVTATIATEGQLVARVDLLPPARRSPPCIHTSPECRARLGDRDCRVDMRSRSRRTTIVSVIGGRLFVDVADLERFRMGRLRWLSGANAGQDHIIIDVDSNGLLLQKSAALPVRTGDRALLLEGCDGRRDTCSQRFGNVVNFRGEPDLPGSNVLLRFPGA